MIIIFINIALYPIDSSVKGGKNVTTSCAFSNLVCNLFVFVVIFAQKYCFSPECLNFPSVVCLCVLPLGPVNNVECLN
jgi:hypothetical protein